MLDDQQAILNSDLRRDLVDAPLRHNLLERGGKAFRGSHGPSVHAKDMIHASDYSERWTMLVCRHLHGSL